MRAGRTTRSVGLVEVALALLIAVPLVAVVLYPGWFVGHDDLHPIRRFEQDVMIRAGQFPVRWYPDVSGGMGSPHPEFYAPLFYLAAQVFLFAGLTLTGALKAALVLVLLGTSLAMFLLAREFLGTGPGLVAAAAVSYAPYHLIDLFVRTAFSELLLFLFLPLSLLAFWRLRASNGPTSIVLAGLSFGGLLLSHTVSLLIAPPILAAFVAFIALRCSSRAVFLRRAAAASLLAVALAAFFLVPLVVEKGAVRTESYAQGYLDYHRHFVAPGQLVWSRWGFGLSEPGENDRMSFRLGLLPWLGAVVAVFRWRALAEWSRAAGTAAALAGALSITGIAMALSISAPIWKWIPVLRFVQFPWRFLALPTLGMAFLCAAAVASFSERGAPAGAPPIGRRSWRGWIAPAACLFLAAAAIPIMGFEQRLPLQKIRYRKVTLLAPGGPDPSRAAPGYPHFTRNFVRDQLLYWGDHLPLGAPDRPAVETLTRPLAEMAHGDGTIEVVQADPDLYRLHVHAKWNSLIRLNVYGFPGWVWRLDGSPAPRGEPVPDLPVLTLQVPEGDHVAEAAYVRTPARWAGDLMSLAGIIASVSLGAAGWHRGGRRPDDGPHSRDAAGNHLPAKYGGPHNIESAL